jgi:hypothetical protein
VKILEDLELVPTIEYVTVDDPRLVGMVVDQVPIGDGSKEVDVGASVIIMVGQEDPGGNGDTGGGDGDSGEEGD